MMTVWRMGDIDLVRLLIDHGANNPYVSPDGKYLFFNSGRNGNYDNKCLKIKRLLRRFAPRND
jgi:hypothetical protein